MTNIKYLLYYEMSTNKYFRHILFFNYLYMNRRQLVEKISDKFDTTKMNASSMLDTFIAVIEESLLEWQEVNIHWFGKFYISNRKARNGYNPQTKQAMTIQWYTTVWFKPWKPLRLTITKKFK